MSQTSQIRVYDPDVSIVFRKTNERFGGLSNMAPGFPLRVNGTQIRTSEALYQACRFPHMPDVQRRIIDESSPMTAKMRTKPFRSQSRPDWNSVRVKIMRWCLRVKLAQNWQRFGELLLATGERPIVEQSRKDDFWGAKMAKDGALVGKNVLGRLLMELRELLRDGDSEKLMTVNPPLITDFLFLQKPIEVMCLDSVSPNFESRDNDQLSNTQQLQPSLFGDSESAREKVTNRENMVAKAGGIGGLRSYTNYKCSSVQWLGEIPEHWSEKRAKYYFKEIDERSENGDEEMLSVSHITGVTPRSQKSVTMFKAESNEGQKRCQPGDLVINTMWAWMAALGVSTHAGIVSPSYGVYRPRSAGIYNSYYLDYLLRIEAYRTEYVCRSTGIRSSRLRLYPDEFLSMPIICPPLEEQKAIVRFLKAQEKSIRKFIRNKRRLIELLKEQRQNIINQAVIRGLDPNVKLKPSGVEWIGDIPAHWEATKLKRVVRFNPSKSETGASKDDESQVVFLPMERISVNGEVDCTERRPVSEIWGGFTYFRRGDVVLAKITPCFENGKGACLKTLETEFGFGTTELIVLRPSKSIKGEFLRFLTSTKQFLQVGEQFMTGAAGQQRIPSDFVKEYPIGLPPVNEQQEILDHIRKKPGEIDQAITRAEREVELIREYRARLISDVVTGQVDVRRIEVPEVTEEELQALDDAPGEDEELVDDEATAEVAQ